MRLRGMSVAVSTLLAGCRHWLRSLLVSFVVERRKAEEARNLNLQTLLEHMAEGVIAVDKDRQILAVNTAALHMLDMIAPVQPPLLDKEWLPDSLVRMLERTVQPDCIGAERAV